MLQRRRFSLLAVLLFLGWPVAARCHQHTDVAAEWSIGTAHVPVQGQVAGFGSAQAMAKRPSEADTAMAARSQKRKLQDDQPAPPDVGQMLLDIPGDPTAGEVVLQSIDPWYLQPLGLGSEPYGSSSSSRTGRSKNNVKTSLSSRGSATLNLQIAFKAVAAFNTSIRLPLLPRTFHVTLESDNGDQATCGDGSVYKDQIIHCPGLVPGRYTATAVDSDDPSLELAQKSGIDITDGAVSNAQVIIELGMLLLEASFGSLAWPGVYARTRITPFGAIIHAQIVGAQIVVYPRTQPDQIWDMQWTGDEGTAPFFLIPGSGDFVANMSVGDTLLTTQLVQFSPDASYLSSATLSQQPQLTQLVADQQLLCTGEVEDIRGESGSFPADIQQLESDGQRIYHPRGFFCRWELLPDYPELTVTVSYSGLLDDESLVLYLGPNNIVKLTKPGQEDAGGVFQSTIWVERSVFVEFQTTRGSTTDVGAFTINWTSSSPTTKGVLTSRTMVVVLGCVSAAGAILAAFCFYCVCCSRRRRGMVVVNGDAVAQRVALLRVPSAVRELLPVKPYQPPEDNPLPGADTEPDCCSICLIEFEAAENVTVLPCMHFYHKECIDSWLMRNCTCPLCKSNVLQAFERTQDSNSSGQQQALQPPEQQAEQQQQPQLQPQHRHQRRHRHNRRSRGASLDSISSDGSEHEQAAGGAAAAGDAVVDVTVLATHPLASSNRQGRLPPLPLPRPSGPATAVLQPGAAAAADYEPTRIVRSPSTAASVGNLLNGTVECDAADFAAAAAAAAAAIAAGARGTDDQAAAAVAGAVNSAYEAAQASVSALRGSSRVWSRRLQGLLRTSSNTAAEAAEATPNQHALELGHVQAAGHAAAGGNRAAAVRSPELVMHVPSRGAISIYAYAGHPLAADAEDSAHEGMHEQPTQLQQEVHRRSATPPMYLSGAAGSSSTAANHTSTLDSWDRPPSRHNASLPEVAD